MKRRTQGLHAVFLSFIFHTFISGAAISRAAVFLSFIFHTFISTPAISQTYLAPGSIVISHISADYGLAGDEFAVLYNSTTDTLDLNGYELRYFTASGSVGSAGRSFTAQALIPPGKHRLLSANDTVFVGAVAVLRDGPFTSGMATTGGQLVLRSSSVPDSIVFAVAWGTVTSYVAGMSDAAVWGGDGMLALVWQDMAYVRISHVFSNAQYVHVPSDSIVSLPSLAGVVPAASDAAWGIPVSIVQGSHGDSSLMLGLDPDATDGFDTSFDVPRPPPPAGTTITAGIYRPDLGLATGEYLLSDIRRMRALADTAMRWIIDLDPAESGTLLSLTLDLAALPAYLPVQARNTASGQRWMRQGDSLRCELTPATMDRIRFLVSVGDSVPPGVAFIQPGTDTAYVVGRTVEISLIIDENSGIDSMSVVFVVPADSLSIAVMDSTGPVPSLEWPLPRRSLTDEAAFRVFVRDSIGNAATYLSPPFAIVPDTQRTTLTPGWHMVSLPLEQAAQTNLFPPEDSAFVFGYRTGHGYMRTDSLEPGKGYFAGLMSGKDIVFPGIPVPDSFTVALQAGFSMISNPGPHAVPIDALSFLSQGMSYSYAGAVAEGLVAIGLFGFDNPSGTYQAADSLRPWEAYWLPVLGQDVAVRFPEGTGQGSLRVVPREVKGWEIRMYAESGGVVDSLFSFGVHPDAGDGFDGRFDVASPPSPPSEPQLGVFAERAEWGSAVGPRFLRDIRRDGSLHVWTFAVVAREGGRITLRRGSSAGTVPEGFLIRDVSTGGGEWEPFIEGWMCAWAGSGTRTFEVRSTVTGSGGEMSDVPAEFTVSQNFPNPFNGMTTVTIGVPERGNVTVRVFDLLGRVVEAVAERYYSPGQHTLTWKTELSSGVYIGEVLYRSAGDPSSRSAVRRKMVLMK